MRNYTIYVRDSITIYKVVKKKKNNEHELVNLKKEATQ